MHPPPHQVMVRRHLLSPPPLTFRMQLQLLLVFSAALVTTLTVTTPVVAITVTPTPIAPYTLRTSTVTGLVDVTSSAFNFTRHGWRGDDDWWMLETPFPVAFYGSEYNEVGVSSNGNIQFSSTSSYTSTTSISEFPSDEMDGAIFAFMADMRTDVFPGDDIRSGVIGVAPNRIFIIDWQGGFYSNSQPVRFQVHFHEQSMNINLVFGAGSSFKEPLKDPEYGDDFYVGVQEYRNTGLFTRYQGDLDDFMQIDFITHPFVGFSGIPVGPLIIPRSDNATITLGHSIRVPIITGTEWTLICTSPTESTLTFLLRLCPIEEVEPCIPSTDVEFRATDYTINTDFTCTLVASVPSDAYTMATPFVVSISLPCLSFEGVPISTLIVPMDSATLQLTKPVDLILPASVGITLTCTMAGIGGAPTVTATVTLCAEGDIGCLSLPTAIFATNADMPSGDYVCVSTLSEGYVASSSYNLPTPFTIRVLRPLPGYKLVQSETAVLSTDGFVEHTFSAGSVVEMELPFPIHVFNGTYTKIGVSPYGNIQFSYAWGSNVWSSQSNAYSLPFEYLGTALMAFMRYMTMTSVRSGMIGVVPERTFIVDCQSTYDGQSVQLQYLLHESMSSSRLSVIYGGMTNFDHPFSVSQIAVALQSQELHTAIGFDGTLTSTTRLDWNMYVMRFSGVPEAPLRAPNGTAQIMLIEPDGFSITQTTEYLLNCTSHSATTTLVFLMRMCFAEDSGCTQITTIELNATDVTKPATYICTSSFVGLSSLDYLLPVPFTVRLLPPISVNTNWTLTVSGPATFPTRVFTNADAVNSPIIELPVQAGERRAVGTDPISLTHWMSGSNCRLDGNSMGDATTPGSRMHAASWTGKDGQLYLYGGQTENSASADLWRYSPESRQWTKLPMSTSITAVHGVRGQSSNETTPGARHSSCAAIDDNGDAWLLGGIVSGSLTSDMFKYSVSSGEWTFVAGTPQLTNPTLEQGVGVAIPGNLSGPGDRMGASCAWSQGKLFIFGGISGNRLFNDMWTYDPQMDEWTWLSGDFRALAINSAPHMTTMAAAGQSLPSHRSGGKMVTTADRKLWLIGGRDIDGVMSDVWSFNPATSEWVFEAGSQSTVLAANGVYGEFRVPSAINVMPGRYAFAAAIDQRAGVIFISGGQGADEWNDDVILSDVWSFNTSSKLLSWVGGLAGPTFTRGSYPAVRGLDGGDVRAFRPNTYGGNAWIDASGGLWLGMGDHGDMMCNDLWFMPSGAGVVTLDLAVAGLDSTVTSVHPALTIIGRNRWVLGRPELDGTFKDYSFTVVGGTGMIAAPFTLRLLQRELFTDNHWSAMVAASGVESAINLTQASQVSAGIINLPVSAAFGMATVTLTLPTGASIIPATATNGVLSVRLGATGSYTNVTFTVAAENGVAAKSFTITFIVAQSSDNSWRAVVIAPGLEAPLALTQASDASAGHVVLPASSALANVTVTFILPPGATVSPIATNNVLFVILGAAGTNTSLAFIIAAEDGTTSETFTVTFAIALPERQIELSSTGSPNSDYGSSSTGQLGPVDNRSSSGSTSIEYSSTGSKPSATLPSSSSTGSATSSSSSTYANATVSMRLNFNRATLPPTLVADIKTGIAASIHFPSKPGQMLHAVIVFLSGSTSATTRRRLLQTEFTQLTIIFTPAGTQDNGAAKAALAFSAQLRCTTPECAAVAATSAGVDNLTDNPQMAALLAAVDVDSVNTIDGVTPQAQPPMDDDDDNDDSGLSDGAIAGIAIGVVVGVSLLVAGACFLMRPCSVATGKASAKVSNASSQDHHAGAVTELTQSPQEA